MNYHTFCHTFDGVMFCTFVWQPHDTFVVVRIIFHSFQSTFNMLDNFNWMFSIVYNVVGPLLMISLVVLNLRISLLGIDRDITLVSLNFFLRLCTGIVYNIIFFCRVYSKNWFVGSVWMQRLQPDKGRLRKRCVAYVPLLISKWTM